MVLVRPVATYVSKTWMLTKTDEKALGLFETTIFGAVQGKDQWRRRYNFEFYKLYDEPDLVKYVRINRLKSAWACYANG
jgi:hypothetical protein